MSTPRLRQIRKTAKRETHKVQKYKRETDTTKVEIEQRSSMTASNDTTHKDDQLEGIV